MLSERAYIRQFSNNPVASEEFAQIYRQLGVDPRLVGERVRREDPRKEHWVYESPQIPRRPRFRVYYTVEGRIVSIEALVLL